MNKGIEYPNKQCGGVSYKNYVEPSSSNNSCKMKVIEMRKANVLVRVRLEDLNIRNYTTHE